MFVMSNDLEVVPPQSVVNDDKHSSSLRFSQVSSDIVITNVTVWKNSVISLNQTVIVTNGGNLTIIGSRVNFTNPNAKISLENDSTIIIRDSMLENGDKAVAGKSRGSFTAQNATFSRFNGDVIKLEGNYSITVENTKFYDNSKDAIDLKLISQPIVVRNTIIQTTGDDGFDIEDSTSLVITNVNVSRTAESGIELDNMESVIIKNVRSNKNLIHGAAFTSIQNVSVFNSELSSNQKSGIQATDITELRVINNTINSNGAEGISLNDHSNGQISNNTISQNKGNGIFVSNNSVASIHYNAITKNEQYGIFAAERTDNVLVDANFNYWGSDLGPTVDELNDPSAIRDEVRGPVNVSLILTSQGNVIEFIPEQSSEGTTQLDPLQVLFIVLSIMTVMGIIFLGYWVWQNWKWRKRIKPHVAFLISPSGMLVAQHEFIPFDEDTTLISGFISAINSFSSNLVKSIESNGTMSETSSLQEIQHQDFTLALRPVKNWLFVIVVKESNPLLRKRMNSATRKIMETLGQELDKDDTVINPEPFSQPFIDICVQYFANLT